MSNTQLPPFPNISALQQTKRFFKDPFALISDCHRDLGDLFALRLLGMGNWVFVSRPDHIKEVFKAPPDVLVSGEINAKMLGFLLGTDATFSLDGDAHLQRRKLMHPYFNGKRVLENIGLIHRVAETGMANWPVGKEFPFLPWSMHVSLRVMMDLIFGASEASEVEKLTASFQRYAEDGLRSPLLMLPFLQLNLGRFSPWGRILALRAEVFAEFDRAVAQRRQNPGSLEQRDIAGLLCEGSSDLGPLSDSSIREEIFNDLFAGHETTAKVLAWALECTFTYPEAGARLREEIDRVLGKDPITADHLKSLPYTQAFLEEVRRMRPLAPFAGVRLVKQPFSLDGFLLPPGTTIVQALPLLAARPEIFDDPTSFKPERFMDMTIKPFTWNPFGGGRRMCLGKGLAEVELVVFLATMLQKFEFQSVQRTIEKVRAGFFFAPSKDLPIRVTPRV